MTSIEPPQEPTGSLAFAESHIEAILTGTKTLTARYDFERNLSPGQVISLETPERERFATACVQTRRCESVADFVTAHYEGHQQYETIEAFLDEMQTYYSGADFGPDTMLTVIEFGDVTRWNR